MATTEPRLPQALCRLAFPCVFLVTFSIRDVMVLPDQQTIAPDWFRRMFRHRSRSGRIVMSSTRNGSVGGHDGCGAWADRTRAVAGNHHHQSGGWPGL